jgi:hypothetical protein
MFRSSWEHHQEGYIISMIQLIEISIWIHIVMHYIPIMKTVKVVENYALCYDDYYNIKISEILEYTRICITNIVEVIRRCCILQM